MKSTRRELARKRLRVLWDLYEPVRLLLLGYIFMVVLGTIIEGMALAAIVPLVGGDRSGGIGGFYGDLMTSLGLDPNSDTQLVSLVGGLFVLRAVAQYGSNLVAGVMVRREGVRLQVELFRLYLNVRWEVAVQVTQGEVNLLLGGEVQKVAQFLRRLVSLMEGCIYTVGLTAVAIMISPENTALALALIGSSAVGVTLIARRVQRYAEGILAARKSQSAGILQYARGMQMLRAFDVAEHAVSEVEQLAIERETLGYRTSRVRGLARVIPDLLFVLALLAVVGLALRSGDSIAEVGAIVALLFRVAQYLKRFSDITTLTDMLPTVRDVHRFRVLFKENQAVEIGAHVDESLEPGSIVLDTVTYRYPSASAPALAGVSTRVGPGEFIGVVGSSGSGKSTLVKIVTGLLEPSDGDVRIGASKTETAWRSLAYVPQEPFILKGTVAENVRWFRDIDLEAVELACENAGLGTLLKRLPGGLNTPVGQEGLTLSGGERQRLALARALAGGPEILVLDEATSALDSESEAAIQAALTKIHGAVTIISVAHRLSTVLGADRLWVLESGRIIEDAPPAELLAQPESRFAQLSALQSIRGADLAGERSP